MCSISVSLMMSRDKLKFLTVVLSIFSLVASVAYIAYRMASERAYREKWKDYNDCGIV